ncbi:MAG: NAD-binding protein, partial [Candidatus Acidiferrales bacterium]
LEVGALAESLALVTAGGVAGERLVEVMQSSMGRAKVLDVKAPLMLNNQFQASFPLRLMHKDMRLALEFAAQKNVTLPAAAASFATYSAVRDASRDDPDYSAVARFWKKS